MHRGRDTTYMSLERDHVECACLVPAMLEELCKRIQHCCATLRRSRNKTNVGSCWLKSFDRFQTLGNTFQQFPAAVQTDATCNIQQFGSCWPILLRSFARSFNEQIGIIIQLISNNSTLLKPDYVALDAPTSTLRSISGKTCWTRSTRVSTNISWRRKVSAINSCITRLTIHLAGINVTITESSCVSSLTCAAHIHEFAVSVDFVTFFWGHALTTVVAGAHVNRGTPGCTRSFIVSGNE